MDLSEWLQSPMHLDFPRDRLWGAHWDKILRVLLLTKT